MQSVIMSEPSSFPTLPDDDVPAIDQLKGNVDELRKMSTIA
ncbi:MAG: hypothetical protein ACI8T1_004615 [Verrucomicrobiales bacterium]|jgi:hypothetical protein